MARDSRTTVHDKGLKKIKSQNLRRHARQRMLTRTHERNILLRIRTHTRTHRQTNRWKTHCRSPSAHSFLRFILCCMCVCHMFTKVLTYLLSAARSIMLMSAWKCLVVSRLRGQLRYANASFWTNLVLNIAHCAGYSLPLVRKNLNHVALNHVARTFSSVIS